MPGYFPQEGQVQELELALGFTPQPTWYLALYTVNAVDSCLCTFADLTQPIDPSYLVQLITPSNWVITPTNPCDATAVYPPVTFFFSGPQTLLGWFLYTDDGSTQAIFAMDSLNAGDGVVIPTGGGSIQLTVTLKTDSVVFAS